ncbi:hypothetical protein [Paenibacillus donghaensis]|uniref:Uncharacterized protein n=1 Tax=Paenibacillus donghaensis TaxID=414771 RepID=A0A2Z2KJN8_9BACL|nr:hypothetical protein [Paenibacillus donghaensis]ASA22539.1 hypothetical protein B9T62_18175 [Paenibacillus donghaensis]
MDRLSLRDRLNAAVDGLLSLTGCRPESKVKGGLFLRNAQVLNRKGRLFLRNAQDLKVKSRLFLRNARDLKVKSRLFLRNARDLKVNSGLFLRNARDPIFIHTLSIIF